MRIPILCYHQVGSEAEFGRRLNIAPEALQAQIRFFKRRGFRFVQASSLIRIEAKTVCLTFDDAYVSTLTYGMERLLREEVTGSIYAVPSKVGGQSDWAGETPKPLADWDLLREAQARGIEIGNHTLTHARMAELSAEEQAGEWREADDRFRLEGLNVSSACWPYGSVGDAYSLPYEVGLALAKRQATDGDSKKQMPRLVIAFGDNVAGLIYKLYVRPFLP